MEKVIKIKKMSETAQIPTRGSEEAAGFDLHADIDVPITIAPHETVKISSGVAFEPPKGYFGAIFPRSGLSTREGLVLRNTIGVCDSDFRDKYIVPLYNDSNEPRTINPQERIAQVVFIPYFTGGIQVVAELTDTKRDVGGFGSTGK